VQRQQTGFAAPYSAVVAGLYDMSGSVTLRVNAASFQTTGALGGNFGAYPTYIGARGGASDFFNGDIYCLSARGALTTDSLIAQMEQWANGRMGRVY
jgi:hypothetical protein